MYTKLLAVMRETMRLQPTVPTRSVNAIQDTVIGGKYVIPAGRAIAVQTWIAQRDPAVWGDDVSGL